MRSKPEVLRLLLTARGFSAAIVSPPAAIPRFSPDFWAPLLATPRRETILVWGSHQEVAKPSSNTMSNTPHLM
jgi:hypothetical protein